MAIYEGVETLLGMDGSGHLHSPAALSKGKSPRYSLATRLNRPHTLRKREKSLAFAGNRTPISPVFSKA
jgi:hypothetical protein